MFYDLNSVYFMWGPMLMVGKFISLATFERISPHYDRGCLGRLCRVHSGAANLARRHRRTLWLRTSLYSQAIINFLKFSCGDPILPFVLKFCLINIFENLTRPLGNYSRGILIFIRSFLADTCYE